MPKKIKITPKKYSTLFLIIGKDCGLNSMLIDYLQRNNYHILFNYGKETVETSCGQKMEALSVKSTEIMREVIINKKNTNTVGIGNGHLFKINQLSQFAKYLSNVDIQTFIAFNNDKRYKKHQLTLRRIARVIVEVDPTCEKCRKKWKNRGQGNKKSKINLPQLKKFLITKTTQRPKSNLTNLQKHLKLPKVETKKDNKKKKRIRKHMQIKLPKIKQPKLPKIQSKIIKKDTKRKRYNILTRLNVSNILGRDFVYNPNPYPTFNTI